MIYSTNRTESLGDVTINANESYYGFGYLGFVQECYEDELSIFESAIKSDIDEAMIGESGDLTALNESFTKQAKEQITKLMTKFIEWIESVKTAVLAKFDKEFSKAVTYRTKDLTSKFNKLNDSVVFTGKAFASNDVLAFGDKLYGAISECKSIVTGQPTKEDVEKINAKLKAVKETDSKTLESALSEYKEAPAKKVFDTQVKIINDTKGIISTVRKNLSEEKDVAKQILKDAKKAGKEAEDKDASALKVQAASAYRTLCVETLKTTMKLVRGIIYKALSTMAAIIKQNSKAVKEDTNVEDIDMVEVATEAAIYEMEEILEGKDCCDDCEEDEDSDDDESDDDE